MRISKKAFQIRNEIIDRNLEFCRDITPEQMETILQLASEYECQCSKGTLLTIELQDETSVPKVFYKGEEITNKVNVSFDWDTSDARNPHGLTYAIEHIEIDNGQATVNRIERRCGDHAT